jgi:iron complex outermembrane receptor protein
VFSGFGQTCGIHLSGHIEDADTDEKLQVASIRILELDKMMVTDQKGDFIFPDLCEGRYTIVVSHVSCDPLEKTILLTKDLHLDLSLPHSRKVLGDIVIDAHKGTASTGFKKELSGKLLDETKGLSLAEALSKLNGVTLLQNGSNVSKPVIHGLHGSRILTINNGVRQEGQQWGNEHAPEIDPFIADKLKVIKGVDELRYGSDAIGGVVLVEPRALRNKPGYYFECNSAFFSNNKQFVLSALFEQQLTKQPAFRYRIQGTYKKGANVSTPNYRLNNTGNEEKNYSLTLGWKKQIWNTELFFSHFETSVGIFTGSHIGNLTDLQNAIAAPKPSDVFLGENKYKIGRPSQNVNHNLIKSKSVLFKNQHKFTLLVAGQFNRRKEFDIVRNANNTNPQLDLNISTITEDLNWERPKKNDFTGMAGIALMQQANTYNGRYFIPNYQSNTIGAYAIEKWSRHKWELQGGVRFDHKNINTIRLKFNGDTINNRFKFSTFAGSFNAIYKANEAWKFNVNLSLSSRAPYVNELLCDGIHHGTATYEKGDVGLKSERSLAINTGIHFSNKDKTFELNLLGYVNIIHDFIYQQPMPDNPVLTIAGSFPLLNYRQTNAMLSGFDAATNYMITNQIEWRSKFSFLYARNTKLKDWLILMPSNRLGNEFVFNFKKQERIKDGYIGLELLHVMQQKNVPSASNGKQDYKEPPSAYTLLNVNSSFTFNVNKNPITIGLSVRNLLNTVYRDYMNSMRYFTDEMGRNISLRIKCQL